MCRAYVRFSINAIHSISLISGETWMDWIGILFYFSYKLCDYSCCTWMRVCHCKISDPIHFLNSFPFPSCFNAAPFFFSSGGSYCNKFVDGCRTEKKMSLKQIYFNKSSAFSQCTSWLFFLSRWPNFTEFLSCSQYFLWSFFSRVEHWKCARFVKLLCFWK